MGCKNSSTICSACDEVDLPSQRLAQPKDEKTAVDEEEQRDLEGIVKFNSASSPRSHAKASSKPLSYGSVFFQQESDEEDEEMPPQMWSLPSRSSRTSDDNAEPKVSKIDHQTEDHNWFHSDCAWGHQKPTYNCSDPPPLDLSGGRQEDYRLEMALHSALRCYRFMLSDKDTEPPRVRLPTAATHVVRTHDASVVRIAVPLEESCSSESDALPGPKQEDSLESVTTIPRLATSRPIRFPSHLIGRKKDPPAITIEHIFLQESNQYEVEIEEQTESTSSIPIYG